MSILKPTGPAPHCLAPNATGAEVEKHCRLSTHLNNQSSSPYTLHHTHTSTTSTTVSLSFSCLGHRSVWNTLLNQRMNSEASLSGLEFQLYHNYVCNLEKVA